MNAVKYFVAYRIINDVIIDLSVLSRRKAVASGIGVLGDQVSVIG